MTGDDDGPSCARFAVHNFPDPKPQVPKPYKPQLRDLRT